MSIDQLQDKIRKTKNPTILELSVLKEQIPPAIQEESVILSHKRYYTELLNKLKGKVPAVRFDFLSYTLLAEEGIGLLRDTMMLAHDLGYYVLMDSPGIFTPAQAKAAAEGYFGENCQYFCDGLVIPGYYGSDVWNAFVPYCRDKKKDVFVAVRTGNRSAPELQDLLSGGRLVHTAAADHVNRCSLEALGKCGYSRISILAGGSSAESLRTLRSKYPRLFILVEGFDYPQSNAKNCSCAFDKLGHGAAVCVGASITQAWKHTDTDGDDYVERSIEAADRIRKNVCRYVNVL